jgi:hypothetical protein
MLAVLMATLALPWPVKEQQLVPGDEVRLAATAPPSASPPCSWSTVTWGNPAGTAASGGSTSWWCNMNGLGNGNGGGGGSGGGSGSGRGGKSGSGSGRGSKSGSGSGSGSAASCSTHLPDTAFANSAGSAGMSSEQLAAFLRCRYPNGGAPEIDFAAYDLDGDGLLSASEFALLFAAQLVLPYNECPGCEGPKKLGRQRTDE